MTVLPRRGPSLYRPLRAHRVQPALLDDWIRGFLAGCAFVSGVATIAFYLIWTAK